MSFSDIQLEVSLAQEGSDIYGLIGRVASNLSGVDHEHSQSLNWELAKYSIARHTERNFSVHSGESVEGRINSILQLNAYDNRRNDPLEDWVYAQSNLARKISSIAYWV